MITELTQEMRDMIMHGERAWDREIIEGLATFDGEAFWKLRQSLGDEVETEMYKRLAFFEYELVNKFIRNFELQVRKQGGSI